jgi:hypothetical protein
VATSYGHSNELSGSIKYREFFSTRRRPIRFSKRTLSMKLASQSVSGLVSQSASQSVS